MALAMAGAGIYGALNGYWGQTGGPNLRTYCDSGIQYTTLAFVNLAPENDKSGAGYPGINFSSHCWAESFHGKNGKETQLLSHCQSLKDDIPYCQSKGVKVILSIGGRYRQPDSDYQVTTVKNGEDFAEFLYKAFGPYHDDWAGPRPFDHQDQHVSVDGFDFDIEAMFDNGPYIAMINKFRAIDESLLITGAPQCPTNPGIFQMKELVEEAAFDALFIQFYNNPSCDALSSNGFNLDDWVKVVSQSRKSKNAKLFVGLPAGPNAAGSGYIDPKQVKDLVCRYKDRKNFGGISLWDLSNSNGNVSGGKSFHEHVLDALRYGCGPVPTSSSSTARTLTTKATTTSKPCPTASTEKPISTTARGTGQLPSSDIVSKVVSSTARWSNSTANSATSAPLITRTVYTTKVHIISSCPHEVTNCPLSHKTGLVVTEIVPLYTTVCPADQISFPPESTAASPPRRSTTSAAHSTNPTVTDSSVFLTTSTVYTTKTQTITSCVPGVTDCYEGQVVTETVPLYTTVCPVTQTTQPPRSTASEVEISSLPLTTSTVYTATSYTITSCLHEVPNCPTGKVVTEVIPWHTTVCPAEETETETAKVRPPTPSGPGSVSRPESTASSQTATATSIRNTVAVFGSSTLEMLTKPASKTPVSPAHSGPSCSGPGCPGGASRPATTTIYTTIAVPGSSTPGTRKRPAAEAPNPGPGCSGAGCSSGIAAAMESLSGRPVRLSTTPLTPVVAGASSLAVRLTGLIAVMAVQVLAM